MKSLQRDTREMPRDVRLVSRGSCHEHLRLPPPVLVAAPPHVQVHLVLRGVLDRARARALRARLGAGRGLAVHRHDGVVLREDTRHPDTHDDGPLLSQVG